MMNVIDEKLFNELVKRYAENVPYLLIEKEKAIMKNKLNSIITLLD